MLRSERSCSRPPSTTATGRRRAGATSSPRVRSVEASRSWARTRTTRKVRAPRRGRFPPWLRGDRHAEWVAQAPSEPADGVAIQARPHSGDRWNEELTADDKSDVLFGERVERDLGPYLEPGLPKLTPRFLHDRGAGAALGHGADLEHQDPHALFREAGGCVLDEDSGLIPLRDVLVENVHLAHVGLVAFR